VWVYSACCQLCLGTCVNHRAGVAVQGNLNVAWAVLWHLYMAFPGVRVPDAVASSTPASPVALVHIAKASQAAMNARVGCSDRDPFRRSYPALGYSMRDRWRLERSLLSWLYSVGALRHLPGVGSGAGAGVGGGGGDGSGGGGAKGTSGNGSRFDAGDGDVTVRQLTAVDSGSSASGSGIPVDFTVIEDACRNGTLLCSLVPIIGGPTVVGVFAKPRTFAVAVSNVVKACRCVAPVSRLLRICFIALASGWPPCRAPPLCVV
jgi:hypothetical protein